MSRSSLRQELDRYLAVRRGLGYDLGTAARILRRFIDFAEGQGVDRVSADLFLRWQEVYGHANPQTWAARFGIVRLFAQWLHGLDPAHEALPRGLMPHRARRPRPYIYSTDEVAGIVAAAAELPSPHGLRGLTYATLFGLIAATGLRLGEALALDADDVDLAVGVLTIRRDLVARIGWLEPRAGRSRGGAPIPRSRMPPCRSKPVPTAGTTSPDSGTG